MSDTGEDEKPFAIERAKTGRAKCKKCKCPIDQGVVRIAKLMSNPFGDGKMKAWHHLTCIFEVFGKQRASTKRIEDPEGDVGGWDELDDEGKDSLVAKLEDFNNSGPFKNAKKITPAKKTPAKNQPSAVKKTPSTSGSSASDQNEAPSTSGVKTVKKPNSRDDTLREFRRLCASVANANAYTSKTAIVRQMFVKGSEGDGFKSDITLWCKMLLPGVTKVVYNLQSKQLVKLFSRMFNKDEDDMLEHLEQGDVAETIQTFFEQSSLIQPSPHSELTIQEVDKFLDKLSRLTREDEQIQHFKSIVSRCTANDLKMIIRLVKHDLRITAGAKHILDAIHDDAYAAFQVSRNLESVVSRFVEDSPLFLSSKKTTENGKEDTKRTSTGSKVGLALMTPVLPMLAEACKSVEMAMKKCPQGMLSEIKYDGERVQVHKQGNQFRYFSRSLKPVMPHKVNHFKDFIPKAFPGGDDLILDSEILMIDTNTGKPLPFGSLGVHKKAEFKDANVCLFVFDCLYYNGETLIDKPMQKRRNILKEKMTVIPDRIMLSEVEEVQDPKDLAQMIAKVIKLGLEGLVLKDVTGKYEPGKRHWLKVKKDYLLGGAMADTADLVVLGAWYGTGKKESIAQAHCLLDFCNCACAMASAFCLWLMEFYVLPPSERAVNSGMMSVFLMGCYDEDRSRWLTVTKVHTGHDDATLERLQDELKMDKIGKDVNLLPQWLHANKAMVPDFVAKDPKKQPVWEITGAEFTNQGVHTAEGISIRFPRVTRIRDDKDWKTATSLKELRVLFDRSSDSVDVSLLLGNNPSTSSNQRTLDSMLKPKAEKSGDSPTNNAEELEDSKPKSSPPKRKPRDNFTKEDNGADDDKDVQNSQKNSANRRSTKRKIDTPPKTEPNIESDEGADPSLPSTSFAQLGKIKKRKLIDADSRQEIKNHAFDNATNNSGDVAHAAFRSVRVILGPDVKTERRKTIHQILETLGAQILEEKNQRLATHVIHSKAELPASAILEKNRVPSTARHVTEAWVDASFSNLRVVDPEPFAVTLTGVYCSCPCPHQA